MKRTNYSSGAPLEEIEGYSRIVQTGPFVFVGGTTSVQPDGTMIGENDSYEQVKYILEKLTKLILQTGAVKRDVISVKIYATKAFDVKEGLKAYSEIFKEIKPLCTMVTIERLNRPTQLVEIEMNAIAGCSTGAVFQGIDLTRTNFSSGAPLEESVGYSRMVKVGPFVYVGGTTSVQSDGSVLGEGDFVAQKSYVLEKEVGLLKHAGASVEDIIKIKNYQTPEAKNCLKQGTADYYADKIKDVKPVLTNVTIQSLNRPSQLIETEMFAIIGAGGEQTLPEWGHFDFRRKSYFSGEASEEQIGYSSIVETGPFVYGSGLVPVMEDGSVYGVEDSEMQEAFLLKKFLKLMKPAGIFSKDVVKCKSYTVSEYDDMYTEDRTAYYEEILKPIKPLYTGVCVPEVYPKDAMILLEMMAVKDCGQTERK